MEPSRNWRAVKLVFLPFAVVVLTLLPVISWSFWAVVSWETKVDAFW